MGRSAAAADLPMCAHDAELTDIIHKEHQGRREHKEIKELVFNELLGRSRVTANQDPTDSPLQLMRFQCLGALCDLRV